MDVLRHLIIAALVLALAVPASAQSPPSGTSSTTATPALRLDLRVPTPGRLQPPPQTSAALHPAAKGAIIGGAIGAARWARELAH